MQKQGRDVSLGELTAGHENDRLVATEFASGEGMRPSAITADPRGVSRERALADVARWLETVGQHFRRVKSAIGPIFHGRFTALRPVLLRRPDSGRYQAVAERGFVVAWIPEDEPGAPRVSEDVPERDDAVRRAVRLPVTKTEAEVRRQVAKGARALDGAISLVERVLRRAPETPYRVALGLDFSNAPAAIGAIVERFCAAQSRKGRVAALYAEMNAFDINPASWGADVFAYRQLGPKTDFDWLPSHVARRGLPELKGMRALQKAYRDTDAVAERVQPVRDLTTLLVMLRFQRLIARAVGGIDFGTARVFAATHDSDLVVRVR